MGSLKGPKQLPLHVKCLDCDKWKATWTQPKLFKMLTWALSSLRVAELHMETQGSRSVPEVSIPRGPGRSCKISYGLALEVSELYYHLSLLVKQVNWVSLDSR